MSKTFDNGVICASEQSVVVVDSVYDAVRERFASHGGYLLQGKELKAVQDIILKKWRAERGYRWSASGQNR